MNEIATIQPQRSASRVEVFLSRMLTAEDRAQLKAALPRHVPWDRFERNLLNALMMAPKLLECNPREVFREVAKIAALGLLIDAQLGEAYLIASNTGPQARIGYRGLIKLGRQSGDISTIYAHEVYENDFVECVLGDEKRLTHKPDLFGDRGDIIGYYAVVKFKDGETDFEPMTPAQINKIRDKSDGYKAFKANKIKTTPWVSDYEEMAKKTCIRRLMKRCPQSPDLAAAISIEDQADNSSSRHQGAIARNRDMAIDLDMAADPETGEIASVEAYEIHETLAVESPSEPVTEVAETQVPASDPIHNIKEPSWLMTARAEAAKGSEAFRTYLIRLGPPAHERVEPYLEELQKAAEQAERAKQ